MVGSVGGGRPGWSARPEEGVPGGRLGRNASRSQDDCDRRGLRGSVRQGASQPAFDREGLRTCVGPPGGPTVWGAPVHRSDWLGRNASRSQDDCDGRGLRGPVRQGASHPACDRDAFRRSPEPVSVPVRPSAAVGSVSPSAGQSWPPVGRSTSPSSSGVAAPPPSVNRARRCRRSRSGPVRCRAAASRD